VRVFVAIDPSEQVRAGLAELRLTLRAAGGSARWVATESIHVTLKFIGEIAGPRVDEVDRALARVRWNAFRIAVRGLGFFPGARKPRILWAGLEAESLAPLAKDIDAALQTIGVPPEDKPFRPHITLARSKDRPIAPELVASVQGMANSDFGSFLADRFYLVESVLKPGGSAYTKIREYSPS
jgi:2'-5' RNA ligase